jgi:Ca2+-transporting ATPase
MLMAALTLGLGYWYWQAGDARWQTVVFTTLALSQMAHVLAIKASTESLVRTGLLSNPLLTGAVVLTIALQLALIYVPAARAVFSTLPLSAADLGLCTGAGAVIVLAVECEKWVIRRRGVV